MAVRGPGEYYDGMLAGDELPVDHATCCAWCNRHRCVGLLHPLGSVRFVRTHIEPICCRKALVDLDPESRSDVTNDCVPCVVGRLTLVEDLERDPDGGGTLCLGRTPVTRLIDLDDDLLDIALRLVIDVRTPIKAHRQRDELRPEGRNGFDSGLGGGVLGLLCNHINFSFDIE